MATPAARLRSGCAQRSSSWPGSGLGSVAARSRARAPPPPARRARRTRREPRRLLAVELVVAQPARPPPRGAREISVRRVASLSSAMADLLQDSAENAVHEARRLGAAVELGRLDRLVDRDLVGNVGAVEDLEQRDPQDRALERRDAVDVPADRVLGDQLVELVAVLVDALASSRVNGGRCRRPLRLRALARRRPPARAAPRSARR